MSNFMKRLLCACLAVFIFCLCGCGNPVIESTQPEGTEPIIGSLQVHFIDVGQADAILVTCDNQAMLIDGGNAEDSNVMYTYLKKNGITHLNYVIGTHAHEDHIGGLAGALNYATVDTVYCPSTDYDSKAFRNFVKAVNNRGADITVPAADTSFTLGGASAQILAVNTGSETNNTSIVLRLVYGSTSFLFMADAEHEVEEMLVERYASSLASTVLKVGHHGSSTSSGYGFIWHVMPQYAVISVGKGNSYGHPEDSVLSRLEDADIALYRTDMQGDIIATSNGTTVSFTVSRNANMGGEPAQSGETEASVAEYILNTDSLKFHYPHCSAVEDMNSKNKKEYTGTREQLLEWDYASCGWCKP